MALCDVLQRRQVSPEELEQVLSTDQPLPAGTQVLVGNVRYSVFEYLVIMGQIDECMRLTRSMGGGGWPDDGARGPLHWTCLLPGFDAERVELLRALLESGADPNRRDADSFGLTVGGVAIRDLPSKCGGKTPLHHLCGSVRESDATLAAIELFLAHGADASLEDHDGNGAPLLALLRGNGRSAQLLRAPPLTESQSEELRAAYQRRCTAREALWNEEAERAREVAWRRRLEFISANYEPRHPQLTKLADHSELFEPSFLNAVKLGTREAFQQVRDFREVSPGLFQFRLLTEEACSSFMEEVDCFNAFAHERGLEVTRPNSMNRYGLVLNDIGFLATLDSVMRQLVQPFAAMFFRDRFEDVSFSSVHAFVVRYKMGEDLDLKTHRDDSDMTLNVCLGKSFEGADLYFHRDSSACEHPHAPEPRAVHEEFQYPHPSECRFCTFRYAHKLGVALMHTGEHVHGVEPLRSGERSNLILWCRRRPYATQVGDV